VAVPPKYNYSGGGFVRRGSLPRAITLVSIYCLGVGTAQILAQDGDLSPRVPGILRIRLDSTTKVKPESVIYAHTIEPLYQSNQLTVPVGAKLVGKITQVSSAPRKKRLAAAAHGDFSPMHNARLEFDRLILPTGLTLRLAAAPAEEGNDVVRFRSANSKRPSFFRRVWADVISEMNSAVNSVTAPNKVGRLKWYMYHQLPWHPEWLRPGAQYDVSLLKALDIGSPQAGPIAPQPLREDRPTRNSFVLHARLQTALNSRTTKQNEPVLAVTTEPAGDSQNHSEIPQGASLQGSVLRVRKGRTFGRNGALRFYFNRIVLPGSSPQKVMGTPVAVDGRSSHGLKIDTEGGVEPDSNKGIVAPLAMGLLAASALHDDEASLGHATSASNGFGLIFRLVAVASGSKTFGGVMGGIAAVRTVYSRFLAHGNDVSFPRNSEIEIELDRRGAPRLTRPCPPAPDVLQRD